MTLMWHSLLPVAKGNVSYTSVPELLQSNRDFAKVTVSKASIQWKDVPEDFKSASHVAKYFAIPGLLETILERFPNLRIDSDFWTNVINTQNSSYSYDLHGSVQKWAPRMIRWNAELMKRAYRCNSHILQLVNPSFMRDRDFTMEHVLSESQTHRALENIPDTIQCLYPDLVARLFFNSNNSWISGLVSPTMVAPALRKNCSVALAWFTAGGAFCPLCFPEEWKGDRDIFLLIAEKTSPH